MSNPKLPPNSLPLLEDIRIASPCHASWDEMTGDDRVRFCSSCSKHVFNLSGMKREEARQLLAEQTGHLCVRVFKREDGTVLTADCPVGLARVRQRMQRLMIGGLALVGSLLWGSLTALGWSVHQANQASGNSSPGIFSRWMSSQQPIKCGPVMGAVPVMGKTALLMGEVEPPVQQMQEVVVEETVPQSVEEQSPAAE